MQLFIEDRRQTNSKYNPNSVCTQNRVRNQHTGTSVGKQRQETASKVGVCMLSPPQLFWAFHKGKVQVIAGTLCGSCGPLLPLHWKWMVNRPIGSVTSSTHGMAGWNTWWSGRVMDLKSSAWFLAKTFLTRALLFRSINQLAGPSA